MILVDMSNLFHAGVAVGAKGGTIELDILRYMLLNSIRKIRSRFVTSYGEVVLCIDNHSDKYWRKDVFPGYKAGRKKAREAASIDWADAFAKFDIVKDEFKQYLPYKLISVPKCEADDVIGTLSQELSKTEKTLIVSNDHDFIQLMTNPNISIYKPLKEMYISPDSELAENSTEFLVEQILMGDRGDGIPNVRSDINSFVDGKRQTPCTDKFKKAFFQDGFATLSDFEKERYLQNEKLISLKEIPVVYREEIIKAYTDYGAIGKRSKLLFYFGSHNIQSLYDKMNDF